MVLADHVNESFVKYVIPAKYYQVTMEREKKRWLERDGGRGKGREDEIEKEGRIRIGNKKGRKERRKRGKKDRGG